MAPAPKFPDVFIEEIPSVVRTIAGVATSIAAFVGAAKSGPINKAVRVLSFAEFERAFGGLMAGLELGYAVRQFFLNGGTEALVVRIAKRATDAQVIKGIRALDRVDLFNLLVLPGITAPPVLASAADYCRERQAMQLIDSPEGARSPAEMELLVHSDALPKASRAALYYPWTVITDPLTGQPRTTPPSGSIAGLLARTDNTRGVWKAPAGTAATLTGVVGLSAKLTDAAISSLDKLGVNCLRTLPTGGAVAWSARTLEGSDIASSEWRYLPIRRLALFLAESIRRGTRWTVFEPNGGPLWAELRMHVGAFLHELFRAGAFQGSTPKDAYFVKCPAQPTTPAATAEDVVTVQIGFAPLRPAEFITLTIRQPTAPTPR